MELDLNSDLITKSLYFLHAPLTLGNLGEQVWEAHYVTH